jgi:hypothetical protein
VKEIYIPVVSLLGNGLIYTIIIMRRDSVNYRTVIIFCKNVIRIWQNHYFSNPQFILKNTANNGPQVYPLELRGKNDGILTSVIPNLLKIETVSGSFFFLLLDECITALLLSACNWDLASFSVQ